jgi:O-antigen/teichoic acid export membrane protein
VLGTQIKRLAKQSAIYGLGGIVSRLLAIFLLPLYTSYLGTGGFGKIETILALTTVVAVILRFGISSAFFRFYFDSTDPARRTLVVRTSFWFTMGMATLGLVVGFVLATPISHLLRNGLSGPPFDVKGIGQRLYRDHGFVLRDHDGRPRNAIERDHARRIQRRKSVSQSYKKYL